MSSDNTIIIEDYFCNMLDDGTVCLYGGGIEYISSNFVEAIVDGQKFRAYKVGETHISKVPFVKGKTNGSSLPNGVVGKIKKLL